MAGENMNNNGNSNVNVNDGDIGFVWENALPNSTCPTLSPDLAQKAAPVVEEAVGEGSAKAEKRRRIRKGKKPVAASGGAGGGKAAADPDHHVLTERERREKMRCKFAELQALLPHAPAKATKSSIVEEAFSFIKISQQQLRNLQKQKLEKDQSQTPPSAGSCRSREAFIADQGSSAFHGSGQDNYQILTAGNPMSGAAPYATTFKTWSTPNMVLNLCGDRAQINICCPNKVGIFGVICFYLEKYMIQVLYATVSCDPYRAMFMIQAHATGGVDQLSVEDLFQLAMGEIMMYISMM